MGSEMILRAARVTAIALGMVILSAAIAVAGGLYLGLPCYTLDLSATFARVPVAMNDATAAIGEALSDMGFSPLEIAVILDGFEEASDAVEVGLPAFPTLVPVPLIGGGIEIGLPLLVIDGLRFTGGGLADSMIRAVAEVAGSPIPQPLFDVLIDVDEIALEGNASMDIEFSSWMLSTEAVKRFDLLLLGVTLGGGLDVIHGRVTPILDIDVASDYASAVSDTLAALRLDEIFWSAFAAHVGIGFEVGLPFLRLYADLRFLMPLSQNESWWSVRVGSFSGLFGFAILF